jgi:hypothetical protein
VKEFACRLDVPRPWQPGQVFNGERRTSLAKEIPGATKLIDDPVVDLRRHINLNEIRLHDTSTGQHRVDLTPDHFDPGIEAQGGEFEYPHSGGAYALG